MTTETEVKTKSALIDALNLAQDITKALDRRLAPLSGTQARVLATVQAKPGITPSEIATVLHQETHSVSGLLNRLEDNEPAYILRTRDRQDRRVVHVALTAAGRGVIPAIEIAFAEAEASLKAGQVS